MEWISVEDRLPEKYQPVIAYLPGIIYSDQHVQMIKWWDADVVEVTHWMPLPEPPK